MLTIVIPTISFSDKLVRAVKSALSVKNDTKVIVLDNSLNGIKHQLISAFDDSAIFEIYTNKDQIDIAENWNRCFEISSSKYTLMLHDDDYLGDDFDLSFLASDADLYILEGYIQKDNEIRKLGNLDKICQDELALQSIIEFPGLQRQLWKTEKIKENKFDLDNLQVFDYIWYSYQIDQSPSVEYSKGLNVIIEYHDEQITKKSFWSLSVAKILFRFLFKRDSYVNSKVHKFLIKHLYDRLKKSIHSDINQLKGRLWN